MLARAARAEIDGLKLITYTPFLRRKYPLEAGFPLYRTPAGRSNGARLSDHGCRLATALGFLRRAQA